MNKSVWPAFQLSFLVILLHDHLLLPNIEDGGAWRNMTWICVINVCKVNSYSLLPIYHKLESVALAKQKWSRRNFFFSWPLFEKIVAALFNIFLALLWCLCYSMMAALKELLPLMIYLKPIIESKSPQY